MKKEKTEKKKIYWEDCECDCHKIIDRDRFGGDHKCC